MGKRQRACPARPVARRSRHQGRHPTSAVIGVGPGLIKLDWVNLFAACRPFTENSAPDKFASAKFDSVQVRIPEARAGQVGPCETSAAQVGPLETSVTQIRAFKPGIGCLCILKTRPGQIGPEQIRARQLRVVEIHPGQLGVLEHCARQVRRPKTRSCEIHLMELGL